MGLEEVSTCQIAPAAPRIQIKSLSKKKYRRGFKSQGTKAKISGAVTPRERMLQRYQKRPLLNTGSGGCRRCRHRDCRSDCRRGHCACNPVLLQPTGKFETLSKGLIVSHQRNKQKLNPVIDIHVIKKFYLPSNCKYIPNLKFMIKPS